MSMKIVLLSDDGTRQEIDASDDVLDAGVVRMGDRCYVYRSSTRFVAKPLFEEVGCYEHPSTSAAGVAVLATSTLVLGPAGAPRVDNNRLVDIRDAQLNVGDLLTSLRTLESRGGFDDMVEASARDIYERVVEDVEPLLGATQMPHQDAIARLLFSSWADVGMRLGQPVYGHLTASERQCVSAEQLSEVARWVSERVKVYCIRLTLKEFGWVHAGDMGVSEIDPTAHAPAIHEASTELGEFVRRVISWPTRELAQQFLTRRLNDKGEVVELTIAQLWEACRA